MSGRAGAVAALALLLAGCLGPSAGNDSRPLGQGVATDDPGDGLATLSGTLLDKQEGTPVAGAKLRLTVANASHDSQSAQDGKFRFAVKPEPACRLRVERDGFQPVQFTLDCSKDADVVLQAEFTPEAPEDPDRPSPSPTSAPPVETPGANETEPAAPPPSSPAGFIPHVVVGVPDSGFNVYHHVYRRPELTVHPCTYVEGYPCEVPALNLTLGAATWQEAFEADRAVWASIKPGDRYWIPGTNIIGAVCQQPNSWDALGNPDPLVPEDFCILDDIEMHGTGTSSSVLSENPAALLVVVEGNSAGEAFLTDGFFPIDIISYSWGADVPLVGFGLLSDRQKAPFFVASSGNEGGFPVALEGTKAHTSIITVGAADAGSRTEPGASGWKTMDYVSEYCRPTAQTRSLTEMRPQYCGTSFSAPTFAGALSKAVLQLRERSGYTGGMVGELVDPQLGVTKADVREALNHTATYEPFDPYDDPADDVPLVLPWYQWGWGYFARGEVSALVECLLEKKCPQRPFETTLYMETVWELRRINSGEAI